MREEKIHFETYVGYTGRGNYHKSACSRDFDCGDYTTKNPTEVTCGNCKRTKVYKEALATHKHILRVELESIERNKKNETHIDYSHYWRPPMPKGTKLVYGEKNDFDLEGEVLDDLGDVREVYGDEYTTITVNDGGFAEDWYWAESKEKAEYGYRCHIVEWPKGKPIPKFYKDKFVDWRPELESIKTNKRKEENMSSEKPSKAQTIDLMEYLEVTCGEGWEHHIVDNGDCGYLIISEYMSVDEPYYNLHVLNLSRTVIDTIVVDGEASVKMLVKILTEGLNKNEDS